MRDWFWVRHAPTHQKVVTGWRDVPADLSDVDALARLNGFLPSPAALVSSDLQRATATAEALSAGRHRLPDRKDLRETHFGAWEGKSFTSIDAEEPALARTVWGSPGDAAPPGGESWHMVQARVRAQIAELQTILPQTPLILVAHFGVIQAALAQAAGLDTPAAMRFSFAPLSVTHLQDLGPDGWRIMGVNTHP